MKMTTAWRLGLGAIVLCVLSWLLYVQVPPTKNHRDLDSGAYVQAANFFLEDGSFARLKHQPYYGLGYPLLLAGIKKMGGDAPWLVIIFQVLIAWFIALLVRRIATLIFSNRAGWIAYFLTIFHLGILVFAQFLLTETVLVFLLTLCAERVITFIKTGCHQALLVAGLVLGLSTVIKAVGILFIIPLIFIVGIASGKGVKFLRNAAFLIVGFILSVSVSMVHNAVVFEGPSSHVSMMKINVCSWYYPHLRSLMYDTDIWDEFRYVRQEVSREELPAMFMKDLLAHPGLAFLAWLKNISKTVCGLYTSNVKLLVDEEYTSGAVSFYRLPGTVLERLRGYICGKTQHTWIKVLGCYEAFFLVVEYLFCLLGLWYLFRRREWILLVFIILYVGYFLGITGHDGCARFRLMFDMVLLACSAGGVSFLLEKRACKNQKNKALRG